MYTITVEFKIHEAHLEVFMRAMHDQAANSIALEEGCHRFDIAVAEDEPCRVFLYELYSSKGAFEAHLKTTHFLQFDSLVADWVESKNVQSWWLQNG